MAHLSHDNSGKAVVYSHAQYLSGALNNLDHVVEEAKEQLSLFAGCDTLIGRGLSGALIVPYVARALGLHWAIARKENDNSHSSEVVEGTIGERWVFFDDLICSGHTLVQTIKRVQEACHSVGYTTTLMGAVMYAPSLSYDYEAVCERLPEGMDPNAPFVPPPPLPTLEELAIASLATPQPFDTQDEKGNPVYASADRSNLWAAASDYFLGFPEFTNGAGKTATEVAMKFYTQKPVVPKAKGGRRQKLMELSAQQRERAEALNRNIDKALSRSMLNLLQERLR